MLKNELPIPYVFYQIEYFIKKPKRKVLKKIFYWEANDDNFIVNFCYNNGAGMIKKISKKELEQIKKQYKNKVKKTKDF